MTRVRARRAASLAALVALSACAAPPPAPQVGGADVPPVVVATFDGRWRGVARLTRGDRRNCQASGARVVTVFNGRFELVYRATRTANDRIAAQIAPDGRIRADDGRGAVEGRVRGKEIDLMLSSEFCEHRLTLTKA